MVSIAAIPRDHNARREHGNEIEIGTGRGREESEAIAHYTELL